MQKILRHYSWMGTRLDESQAHTIILVLGSAMVQQMKMSATNKLYKHTRLVKQD